jgi:3-oxoacyl-[acyl-carrier protein] reductase
MNFDFKGQVVIVTGGTRGIGRAISEGFLKAGAKVIATYASNDQGAEDFKRDNQAHEERIDIQKFDVSDPLQVEEFFQYMNESYDTLEVLVNNSGIRRDAMLAMMRENDWNKVLDVNLSGVFHMCKSAVKSMVCNRYGRIINITSPAGKMGFAGQTNYCASKAGQVGLTRALSKEVASKNSYLDSIPLKRFGKPDEVAHSVLFLASKEAEYITGATLEITGGL